MAETTAVGEVGCPESDIPQTSPTAAVVSPVCAIVPLGSLNFHVSAGAGMTFLAAEERVHSSKIRPVPDSPIGFTVRA
jgi:hypothetical protein